MEEIYYVFVKSAAHHVWYIEGPYNAADALDESFDSRSRATEVFIVMRHMDNTMSIVEEDELED